MAKNGVCRKTTTLSFRIDDELKNELTKLAERENKTITNKAKEVLIEALNLKPAKKLSDEIRENIQSIDTDLKGKLKNWDMEIQSQLNLFKLNRDLLNQYRDLLNQYRNQYLDMRTQLEKEKKTNKSRWVITTVIQFGLNAAILLILVKILLN
ncbi:hypothetical protein FXI36_24625 [Escherichia coli]|nr:hypothetical protein [Escherichia coli]